MSIADLRASLAEGLHPDNLRIVVSDCSRLVRDGVARVPLFVLQGCLGVLLDLKEEAPVSAPAVTAPDREFAKLADRLLASLEAGQDGPECWPLLDGLVHHVASLPDNYPTG